MFVTVLLPYSIFRFVCISRFVIFLIGLQIVLWIPNQLSPWHLPFPPAPQMDRCSSLPCRFCLCASAGKRPSNSVCKFLQDRVLPARRTRFLSKCNTSKRPSKSTTLLLPNLIIVLIIGPWIGPALAPFLSFLSVAVHISMSQTNHRYTSHGMAIVQLSFFFSAIRPPSRLDTG
jgi:hypothetical protein